MSTQQHQQYVESFRTLHENQALTAFDLHHWFSLNINNCCEELSGQAGRALDQRPGGGMYAVFIEENDNKLFARLEMSWYYDKQAAATDDRPRLELMAEFLNLVHHLKLTKQLPNALQAQITLDLKVWKNYAASLLSTYLYETWVNPHRDTSFREEMQSDATLIIEHVYPNVRLEFLKVAADLGMVSRDPSLFTNWFHQYLQGVDRESAGLSGELTDLTIQE